MGHPGVHNRVSRLLLLKFGLICMLLAACGNDKALAAAAEETATPNAVEARLIPGYCGLYCLHAAMQLLGRPVEFAKLVSPRYLGSRRGSTIAKLSRAAEANGLHVKTMRNLSCNVLPVVDVPLLLHVRSKPTAAEYDHWILLLGAHAHQARIYDAGTIETVSMQHLAGIWDGLGLFVSDRPVDLTSIYLCAASWVLGLAAVCLIAYLGLVGSWRELASTGIRTGGLRVAHRLFAEVGILLIGTMTMIGALSLMFAGGYLSGSFAARV